MREKPQHPKGVGAFLCYNFNMQFDPDKITFFGRTDARGKNVAFGIKAKDRQRHVYVIGKTGMGKSTLLENMAVQDIQNGEGMAFIDPHGSAAETLLNYIPEHRIKDVLYFAPADASHPVSFNIMEDIGPDKRHLVVSGLMSVFKKIWVDAWSARMEYILSNTLLALLEYPDSTLIGVNRMLSDKEYRKKVVDNVKDPGVRAFWVDEFAKYNERYMQEAGDAIKNKIGQFTANPIIRNIIGQPKSSFDIREMMDNRKIIIMNLSKGLIGETNANLLGSMLTTRIYLAAMSRADLSLERMRETPNFYFYVDEFQSFANATFANILSEARKYHLNLTIAHQYIEQMEEDVRNAVFGNVGTIISFRVGPFDAEVLETIFTPQFLATDIVNLGFAQVYLTLMIDGIGSQPFSATTLPPIQSQPISYRDMVIAASREQYARPRADVEVDISKFHEPIVIEKPLRKVEVPSSPLEISSPAPSNPQTRPQPFVREQKKEGLTETRAPQGSFDRRSRNEDRREQPRRPYQQPPSPSPHRVDQNSTSRPTREDDTKKKTENADDLRSILKKIVTEDQNKTSPQVTNPAPKGEGTVSKNDDSRNALRAVLNTVTEDTPTLKSATVPQVPEHIKEITPLEKASPRTPSPQPHAVSNENLATPPSPRELERMMRITTSDKPPY